MELTLSNLKSIIKNISGDIKDEEIMVVLEIKDVFSSDIFRVGYEMVYDPDGSVNTGILKISATGGMVTKWTPNEDKE